MSGLVQAGYLTSSLLCIGSLSGLASQATARQGNILGILGVISGILASLAAVGFSQETLTQFAGVAAIGGLIGTILGRRVTAIELPQMVAALHSVVGLAAVLTSIASVMGDLDHISTSHLVCAYLGVLIGMYNIPVISLQGYLQPYRWCNIHWLHRCVLETGRSHVLETPSPTRTSCHQLSTARCKRVDYECFHFDSTDSAPRGGCISGSKYYTQFHQGFHDHCSHWWC